MFSSKRSISDSAVYLSRSTRVTPALTALFHLVGDDGGEASAAGRFFTDRQELALGGRGGLAVAAAASAVSAAVASAVAEASACVTAVFRSASFASASEAFAPRARGLCPCACGRCLAGGIVACLRLELGRPRGGVLGRLAQRARQQLHPRRAACGLLRLWPFRRRRDPARCARRAPRLPRRGAASPVRRCACGHSRSRSGLCPSPRSRPSRWLHTSPSLARARPGLRRTARPSR